MLFHNFVLRKVKLIKCTFLFIIENIKPISIFGHLHLPLRN